MTDRGSAIERALCQWRRLDRGWRRLNRGWRRLDRGWQAICVAVLLVGAIAGLDLPIPW
ncbi:hypothetical protein [Halopenitus persicus]|uniref:hypothetical protein n=1 Tax=Halopenitus persicus TaxID=1048396 RepID=UPI0012FD87F5|nr:hypothetical protein [Halopenitus persicus]